MSDYELSIIEGDNTVSVVAGDNIVTLGIAVPITGLLGTPPDGSFADGYVSGWDHDTSVAKAVDDINTALKTVAESAGGDVVLGTPTDGSFADGYVGTLAPDMRPVDAIDLLNEGLLEVSEHEPTFTGLTGNREETDGLAGPFGTDTHLADAIIDINVAALELESLISGVENAVDEVGDIAHAPGQQPLGEPSGGWSAGYAPLAAATLVADGVNAVNAGLAAVSTVADEAADHVNALAAATADEMAVLAQDINTVNAVAHAPGQQAAGAPTGGWQAGYGTLGPATLITDGLNIVNQGLGVVAATAAAPGAGPSGTPAGGWSAGYAAFSASTPVNGALNLLNAGLKTVSDAVEHPQAAGQQAAGTPAGGWQAGYAALDSATAINAGLNLLNAGLLVVSTAATAAASAAAAANTNAEAPGGKPLGMPAGGWQAGYGAIGDATAINAAINALNLGLHTVDDAAQDALSTAQTPGSGPLGAMEGGYAVGYVALSDATPINTAINTINEGLRTVSLAAAKTGTPTDGSFNDGLVTLSATASIADSIDTLNEAAASLLQNSYTFNTITNAAAGAYAWAGRARLLSASDGVVSVNNAANNAAGAFQAGLFQVATADGAVQFGNTGKTNGLAIGSDTVGLKVANTNALNWTYNTMPVGTLAGTLTLSRAGTAAAPTLGFSATDGLFAPAAGDIGIATGGVQRLRISAAGLVGLGTDPVTGSILSMAPPNSLSTEYTLNIISADALRWCRFRNDGRLMVQPYMQCNNVVVGIWGNSAIGSTTGAVLDFSNNIATTPYSFTSASTMSASPTFQFNARSSAGTLDLMRWQQNGTTVATMANGGALSAPGFYPNATQAAAGTLAYADSGLLNGMGINTTNNALTLKTNNIDALTIDNTQSVTLAAGANLLWSGRGAIASPSDGIYQIRNAANTAGTLQLGPATLNGLRLATGSSQTATLYSGANGNVVDFTVFKINTNNSYSTAFYSRPSPTGTGALTYLARTASTANVTLTGLSSASTTSVTYDNGFYLVAVIVRVTTAITGATGFNIGDTGTSAAILTAGASLSATAFGSNVAASYASSTGFQHYTVAVPRWYGPGTLTITITPVGAATFTAGAVAVTYIVEQIPKL